MGSDMAVALGAATVGKLSVFGHNSHRPANECPRLVRAAGREFALGESVQAQRVRLPQVRQTYTVLASNAPGIWGYRHGVNEHLVAAGFAPWGSRLGGQQNGLAGADLVRLMLERCRSARQAVDLLTDLVVRHGQDNGDAETESDSLFLIADPHEAFAVETAGNAWVLQQVLEARAASAVGIIRQDWDRISSGLADRVAREGWWECDGNKLDFAGSLGTEPTGRNSALRRWGRSTFLLEQQSGRIDAGFVRKLLGDHYDGTRYASDPIGSGFGPVPMCRHGRVADAPTTSASLVITLNAADSAVPYAWCAFGPPCISPYFPVFLDTDLPAVHGADNELWRGGQRLREFVGTNPERWQRVRESRQQLQSRFDQELEDFLPEAASFRRAGKHEEFRRLAGILMQSHVEQFQDTVESVLAMGRRQAVSAAVTSF